ncbi:hypothetical protein BD769DRAFT_1388702 [Suillus cothurnatus]|nr:hypothetical protein BD769DRAFT_1388702 [Suillus cothurnatus]
MLQHFEFRAPLPLDDDHELQVALTFDFDTPMAINPHPLTPAFMHPLHSALMWLLPSAPVASSSASQQAFVSDIDDSYIPPLLLLESYYDMEPHYLAPYHPLPDQISSFFPEFIEPVLSMDNDALLPVGTDFHDKPRQDGIYRVKDALTQKNSGKQKLVKLQSHLPALLLCKKIQDMKPDDMDVRLGVTVQTANLGVNYLLNIIVVEKLFDSSAGTGDLYSCHTTVLDVMNSILSMYKGCVIPPLHKAALACAYHLIHLEDKNTKYQTLDPVSKTTNLICRAHVEGPGNFMWLSQEGMMMCRTNGSQLWNISFITQALVETGLTKEEIKENPKHHTTKGAWSFSTERKVYMNPNGSFASYMLIRGPKWLEWANPAEVFVNIMIEFCYPE